MPVAAAVGLTLWLNARQFGSPFQCGYNDPVMTGNAATALFGLTVGVNKGLLWFAPPAFLGVLSMRRVIRSRSAQ